MTSILRRRALLAGCLSLGYGVAHAAAYTTTAFNIAGATYVYPVAINDAGTAVGYYGTSKGNPQGFVYAKGVATTLSYPRAVQTYVTGINNSGTIVGTYRDRNGFFHGFVYTDKDRFIDASVPNATATSLEAINDKGVAVGSSTSPSGVTQVVTWAARVFTPLNITTSSTPVPVAIDKSGEIAGWYNNPSAHGESSFVYAGGVATIVANPGTVFFSQAYGMNKHGIVVGQAATTDGHQYGFSYRAGHYKLYASTCPSGSDCFFQSINDSGVVVGSNFTGPATSTGFVWTGTGAYITLPAPNGTDTNYGATAINNAGVIVGEASVGAFISTPTP
jgi:probable HAF family extracellular repeat protein